MLLDSNRTFACCRRSPDRATQARSETGLSGAKVLSNIIIYASQPEFGELRELIAEKSPYVSAISYVELLGYHQLTEIERSFFEAFFQAAPIIPLSNNVLEQAIKLRQLRKMTLGDALIAARALVHNLTIFTRNQKDFDWIPNLPVINPIDASIQSRKQDAE